MIPAKERYIVTHKFDATGVGELDQCSSILGAETDDTPIKKGVDVLALPRTRWIYKIHLAISSRDVLCQV
jgi:hypothetical protein